ncbi:MAG: hypothetical protein GF364_22850 [Candidatus Lokiarchaeota archaeon]|nr:hypothetical protein [Candidatus Lokiarchaeota archaeon]
MSNLAGLVSPALGRKMSGGYHPNKSWVPDVAADLGSFISPPAKGGAAGFAAIKGLGFLPFPAAIKKIVGKGGRNVLQSVDDVTGALRGQLGYMDQGSRTGLVNIMTRPGFEGQGVANELLDAFDEIMGPRLTHARFMTDISNSPGFWKHQAQKRYGEEGFGEKILNAIKMSRYGE